jgi:ferredoxin
MPEGREAQDLIRELLVRELDTVNVYTAMVAEARTPAVRALIAEITAQEKHHIAEAMDLLSRYDAAQAEALAAAGLSVREPVPEQAEPSGPAVVFEPSGTEVAARENETLLAAALRSDVEIRHVCGGKGECGTCRVEVLAGDALTPVTDPERKWLGEKAGAGWRLACQTKALGPARLRVPSAPKD